MNKSLKEGEVNELKLRADIFSIISNYVNLKKSGKNYTGLCPFHKEKTPSFTVDTSKQLFHCFGCGEGGDVISFIIKKENMEFLEAVEFLAKKVGYNLRYVYSASKETEKIKTRLFELNELAKNYYNYILFNSKKGFLALNYLKDRGFKKEVLEKFKVGFSINDWTNFSDFAKRRGYSNKDIIECGLAIEGKKNKDEIYDRFRGRIMFPINNVMGNTVGFGGRIIPSNSRNIRESAKYINTPETKLYSKSKNIYGIFEAKNHIIENDNVLIVEGYTDLLALWQNGIKNVVASLGTALTINQIELLGRFTKNIILVFDSDKAGIIASLKGMERLKEYNEKLDLYHESNIDIKVSILGEGYDPADFIIKKGKKIFLEKIKASVNIIDFTIDAIIEKYDISDFSQKMKAINEALAFISTLSSRIIQEECIKKISQRLNLKESLLIEEMLKKAKKNNSRFINLDGRQILPEADMEKIIDEKISPLKNIEIEALSFIIKGVENKMEDLLGLGLRYFRFEDTKELYLILKNKINKAKKTGKEINFPLEITSEEIENKKVKKLYNYAFFKKPAYKNEKVATIEVINNLKKLYISEEVENIKKQMVELENEIRKKINFNKEKKEFEKESKLENEYDILYKKLIELEKEKMKLSQQE